MSYIVVDVESDSPSPSQGSMVCFGAVLVNDLSKTFYGKTAPISDFYMEEALAVSGFTRDEHVLLDNPFSVMNDFALWLEDVSEDKPVFISDNPAFDWQWINFYFHRFLGYNPFGFSARRIGDLYCGMVKNSSKNGEWKARYRKTKHDHNPVNDAMGNAEALLEMQKLGLRIKF